MLAAASSTVAKNGGLQTTPSTWGVVADSQGVSGVSVGAVAGAGPTVGGGGAAAAIAANSGGARGSTRRSLMASSAPALCTFVAAAAREPSSMSVATHRHPNPQCPAKWAGRYVCVVQRAPHLPLPSVLTRARYAPSSGNTALAPVPTSIAHVALPRWYPARGSHDAARSSIHKR